MCEYVNGGATLYHSTTSPEERIHNIICGYRSPATELPYFISPPMIRTAIRNNWKAIKALAHQIHEEETAAAQAKALAERKERAEKDQYRKYGDQHTQYYYWYTKCSTTPSKPA